MKDNFQGPQYNLDRQPGQSYAGQGPHGPPQGHHAGPHTAPTHQASGPWAQPSQQDKPPFSKPSPNFDRKYPEADKRPMMAKTLNEPPRNDYNAKPGPRFSPRRDIPDSHGKPGPRFSPRRDIIDSHSKPGPRFSPRRDLDPHTKPGSRFSPRRDVDPHSKPGPRFSPRRDIDPHSKPGPRFSPRRDVPDKPGPRFSPRRDVSDLHRRMPSPGRRMPSPGRRMPSPGRRMPSPGRRMPSPGRRMPSPGRRMPSPGRRMPSPGRRMPSPGHRMPSPGKGRGRPITPPHKRHNSPGRYSPRRIDKPSDKFGSDGRPLKDVRPAYDPPAQAPNQAMFSGGYRPSLHENVQYPIPGARPMEPRPSTWQERDKAFPPGGKKEDDRRMPKFEPRIDAELKGRSPPRKSRSPIRRDRSPPRDRFKKHSPSPRSPRRSWALEKRRSPEAREAPPPPMWPGQPQEEPFRRYPDRPEEEKKRMPVWEPRRPEDERSFENPLRVRSDLISRPPEPSSRSYKPDDRIPPRESRFEPREPKFESRDPKFDSRFEPREDFRRADDMLRRFDRDVREPHRPIDDVRRRDEFTREDYPRREEERKIPTKADKFPETFDKEIEDVYQRAQALKKRSEELRKRDLERRREELERDARKPEFDSKFDRRDDRPPESGYAKDKRVAAAAHDIAHKAKRDKAIDEISTKITDKHGSHFTGEMRTRVLEEMRIVVGKAMQDMFGYKDVSFIEMVVKFNAKYDQNAELRMYNDVLSSLPSMYRNMHANKRPANDSRASEIPSKSARHDHEMGLNRVPEWKPNPVPPMMVNLPPPTIHIPNPMLMPQFDLVQQMGMMAQPLMVPAPTYDKRDDQHTFTAQLAKHLQAAENLVQGGKQDEGYNLYLCKDDFAPYSSIQAEYLKKFLVAELIKASQSGQDWSPDFTLKGLQSVFRYEVETRDEATKQWLIEMDFSEFKLFNVLVYSKEELWYERAAVWLPGHSRCRNIEPLEKLRLQNSGLEGVNIGKWKLVKKVVTAKGTRIYVDMPPSSARALEKYKMVLSYELQKVNVFLKAVAVDKEAFDAGLRENAVTNDTVIADAAQNSIMPSIGNDPKIVNITLKGNKSITVQQARKIKEMLIYHIFKHHQSLPSGLRTDFVKFGYSLPGYLGVVPENAETKKWLMGINIGKLNKHPVVVLGVDETNTKYIKLSVTLSRDDNSRSKALIFERLKQSNQGVKGLNFSKWKALMVRTPRDTHRPVLDIEMDLESVETIINELNYTLDYVGDRHEQRVVQVKYEHSEKRLLELINKLKSEMDDSYDVANMEIASSDENDDDIVFMGEIRHLFYVSDPATNYNDSPQIFTERPISRPLKYENKLRAEPLEQRKAVHSRLVAREKEVAKKRPATREDVKAKKPKLSKELAKKIADAQMPASDGYELNQAMSKALETELQDIIIKAWQELPDVPPTEAEAIVTDKFRNEAGDDLRNALGLNVTKRILNVANPFNVKIEFDTQPFGPCAKNFLRWLNCETMRRTLDGQHNYCAVLPTQADFDRVVSKPTVRIGTLKAKIKPHYRFTKCPPKLKTSYKCSKKKMPEQEIKKVITDLNNKLDATETEDKKTTHPVKAEVKKEVKKPAEVKTEAKKLTEVKTEAKKTTEVKSEAKKTTDIKTEANKPTEVKTEANKPTETEAKKPAEVKTDTKKPMNEPKKKTEVKTPTEIKTAKKSPPKKVEATVKTGAKPVVTPKPTDSKTNVTKVTAKKSQATPKKEAVTKTTPPIKPKDTKTVTKVNEKAKTTTKKTTANKTIPNKVDNKKKQRKQSDFDELDDEDILALMSNAIVLDECAGSDED
ncbi:hypothetical protein O0L34_g18772 [Tuta absoluta]|nr:hypothetical protein O0L34_g18772 [Tuta absoluta]